MDSITYEQLVALLTGQVAGNPPMTLEALLLGGQS